LAQESSKAAGRYSVKRSLFVNTFGASVRYTCTLKSGLGWVTILQHHISPANWARELFNPSKMWWAF